MSYGAIAGAFGGVNVTLTRTVFSLIVGEYDNGGILGMVSSPALWATAFVLSQPSCCRSSSQIGPRSGFRDYRHLGPFRHGGSHGDVRWHSYFQDYLRFGAWEWAVFIVGNVIAIISVIGLSHLRLRDAEAKGTAGSIIPSLLRRRHSNTAMAMRRRGDVYVHLLAQFLC